MNKIDFSIVVPVYNTKLEWLNECIQSLLNQTYNNYEIIIIDDGSRFEVKDFLDKLNNYKIKVFHQKNQGIVKSRCNGISKASGKYILHVDSDDFVSPNAIEILSSIAEKDDLDCIIFKSYVCHNNINNKLETVHYFSEGPVDKKTVLEQLVSLHINPITDKCIKRELYEDILLNVNSSIINGEDLQQSTYLITNSNSFYYTNKIIEYYRINEEAREYYDIKKISEVNFLMPTYNMLFKNNNSYIDLLDKYKLSSYKAILYIAFQICWLKISFKEIISLLDELINQEIVILLSSLKKYPKSVYSFIFNLLIRRNFFLIYLLSLIYKLVY